MYKQLQTAVIKFHKQFDEALYNQACECRSPEFADVLLQDAWALCGHPFYRWEDSFWSCYTSDAVTFLKKMLDN